ncbi:MAG: hypothetical protein E7667_03720 [Ruminococcaceae bacterium]|nr:hypothetical protein [Oscillospiraceae bacterium]
MRRKNKIIIACSVFALVIAAILLVVILRACKPEKLTKDGRLDYVKSDMTKFVEITPSDYNKMVSKISKDFLVTDEEVDAYIKNLLFANKKQLNGGESVIDEAAVYGDTAYIFYEGFIDGSPISSESNMSSAPDSPYAVSIGSGEFHAGLAFEEQLIGIVPNQTSEENRISIKVKMPEVYAKNPDIAGKEVEYLVYVKRVVQYEVPELNPATIINILKYKSAQELQDTPDIVSEYKTYIKKNLEAVQEGMIQSTVISDLMDQLIEKVEFIRMPESEMEFYKNEYMTMYQDEWEKYSSQGYKFKDLGDFIIQYNGLEDGADWEAFVEEQYTTVIKQNLICHAIAQIEGYSLTDEEYEAEIQYYIQQAESNGEKLTRADIVETVGEYNIKLSAMYGKICAILYKNAEIVYE